VSALSGNPDSTTRTKIAIAIPQVGPDGESDQAAFRSYFARACPHWTRSVRPYRDRRGHGRQRAILAG
jgi:hypothetical protein